MEQKPYKHDNAVADNSSVFNTGMDNKTISFIFLVFVWPQAHSYAQPAEKRYKGASKLTEGGDSLMAAPPSESIASTCLKASEVHNKCT